MIERLLAPTPPTQLTEPLTEHPEVKTKRKARLRKDENHQFSHFVLVNSNFIS